VLLDHAGEFAAAGLLIAAQRACQH
jgi:hypothetical protein